MHTTFGHQGARDSIKIGVQAARRKTGCGKYCGDRFRLILAKFNNHDSILRQ
jgi:hypothetical protein